MSTSDEMAAFVETMRHEFLIEAVFLLEQCEEAFLKLEDPDERRDQLAHIFRVAHTIKGSGATVGYADLAAFAHVVEDFLCLVRASPERLTTPMITLLLRSGDALRQRVEAYQRRSDALWDKADLERDLRAITAHLKGTAGEARTAAAAPTFGFFDDPPAASAPAAPASASASAAGSAAATGKKGPTQQSVKVDVQRIDGVLDMVGELVVIKSQLLTQTSRYAHDLPLSSVVGHLDKIVRDLQERALGMRLMPLKQLFLKMQRLARDVALKLDKAVDVVVSGEDLEIDRNTVEMLADPLMHVMRNAIDHGIEPAAVRAASGKAARARISLSAQQIGSRVIVKVTDDGAGIVREKVVDKAIQRGLITAQKAAAMSDGEVHNLLFAAGFSTAESVTDLSGRGVGLDVVRTNMALLKGSVELTSVAGAGSTFQLSTPLSASITDGIVVSAGGAVYVLPMDGVRELIKSTGDDITRVDLSHKVIRVRGMLIPLVGLGSCEPVAGGQMILVASGDRTLGLGVDQVIGQTQVVLKPVPEGMGELDGVSGVAVMGNGAVALVADVDRLVRKHLAGTDKVAA